MLSQLLSPRVTTIVTSNCIHQFHLFVIQMNGILQHEFFCIWLLKFLVWGHLSGSVGCVQLMTSAQVMISWVVELSPMSGSMLSGEYA